MFLERLRALQVKEKFFIFINIHIIFFLYLNNYFVVVKAKAGIKTESTMSSQARTPVGDNRTLIDTMNENTLPRTHNIDPQLEVTMP